MNRAKNLLLLFSAIFLLGACKKEGSEKTLSSDANILAFTLTEQLADTDILDHSQTVNVTFTPDVIEAYDFNFELLLSEGAVASIGNSLLLNGLSGYDFDAPFFIDVTAEDTRTFKKWEIVPSNNTVNKEWGLGGFQKQSESNNRDYDWYLDQAYTGTHSDFNCGPTATTMAAKWSNESFSLSPEDARAAYRPGGGWWYTGDIGNYLTDNNVNHHFIPLSNNYTGTANILKQNIDAGNIAIICLDMYYIRSAVNNNYHADKFFSASSPDWGHFILLKGYKEVDNQYFFEIYDPYCYNKTYDDGSLKGKDRFYRANDLFDAISIWWNYSIIITPSGTKSIPENALDPALVPQAYGR